MMANSDGGVQGAGSAGDERRELSRCIAGFVLALVLTLIAFALVYWRTMPGHAVLIGIGVLAVIQAVVHFRYFLHVGTRHNVDEFKALLFTILMLVVMVGGTLWVMNDLAMRMMLH